MNLKTNHSNHGSHIACCCEKSGTTRMSPMSLTKYQFNIAMNVILILGVGEVDIGCCDFSKSTLCPAVSLKISAERDKRYENLYIVAMHFVCCDIPVCGKSEHLYCLEATHKLSALYD